MHKLYMQFVNWKKKPETCW